MLNTLILYRATMIKTGEMTTVSHTQTAKDARREPFLTKDGAKIVGLVLAMAALSTLAGIAPATII